MMEKNIGFNTRLTTILFIASFTDKHWRPKTFIWTIQSDERFRKGGNLIKAKSLNLRLFFELRSDEKYETLLLYIDIRWLSRGRVLGRLFELCAKVREFLRDTKSEYITYFEWCEWCCAWSICLTFLIISTKQIEKLKALKLKLLIVNKWWIDFVSALNSGVINFSMVILICSRVSAKFLMKHMIYSVRGWI